MVDLTLVPSPALHPHLIVKPPPAREGCSYHLSLAFPDAIFVDRDELRELWDKGDGLEWTLSPTKIDIERPVDEAEESEAVILNLEIASATPSLDIPLHTRYLRPNSVGREDVQLFEVKGIQEGWACGDQAAPPSLTAVHHAPLTLSLPTGNTTHEALVMLITPLVIWVGWTCLARKIKRLSQRVDMATVKDKTV